MTTLSTTPQALVRVERIALRGPGVVILTGPSSCGKGEVANALCDVVSIDPRRHLSMGAILRSTVERAKSDPGFAKLLAEKYDLSNDVFTSDFYEHAHRLRSCEIVAGLKGA